MSPGRRRIETRGGGGSIPKGPNQEVDSRGSSVTSLPAQIRAKKVSINYCSINVLILVKVDRAAPAASRGGRGAKASTTIRGRAIKGRETGATGELRGLVTLIRSSSGRENTQIP